MLRKQTALATLLLIMACRSEDSLIGDSNVYLDTEENTIPPNGNNGTEDSTGSECIPGANLEVQSFQATPNTATDDENTNFDALSCGVDGHAITIKHNGVLAHCDQNWSDIGINTEEEFILKISYGFEPVTTSDCTYDLEYTIDLQNCGLPAGIYQILAHGEETEVDLSYVLSEAEGNE